MSHFALSIAFGVAAACVYGTCIVLQHRSASRHGGGEESAAGLLLMLRDPQWVAGVLGDFVGFVLSAIALSIGQVVYVQPLVVLTLPVALFVQWRLGGSAPRRGDYLGVVAVIGGLAAFITLIEVRPGHHGKHGTHHQHIPHPQYVAMTVAAVLIGGTLLCLAVRRRRSAAVRGAVYGAVAGSFFGTIAVMIDASSDIVGRHDLMALFTTRHGLVVFTSIVLLGVAGIVVTQISFQVGALAATLPANLAADPLFGVFLGVVLLRERIPLTPLYFVAYAICLGTVLAGAIRLAAPAVTPLTAADRTDGALTE
jgi:hypothetical protein